MWKGDRERVGVEGRQRESRCGRETEREKVWKVDIKRVDVEGRKRKSRYGREKERE